MSRPESYTGLKLTAAELLGDMALKQYGNTRDKNYLVIGILGYAGVIYYLQDAFLNGQNLNASNSYWNSYNEIITGLVGHYVFKEQYTNREILGDILIAAGALLIDGAGSR